MVLCKRTGWPVFTVPHPFVKIEQLEPYKFDGSTIPENRNLRSALPTVLEIECDDLAKKVPPIFKPRWNELIIKRLEQLGYDYQHSSHQGQSDYFRIILKDGEKLTTEQITNVKTNLIRKITKGIGYDQAHVKFMEKPGSNPRWTMLEGGKHYKKEHNGRTHKIIKPFISGEPIDIKPFLHKPTYKKAEYVFQIPFTSKIGEDEEDTKFKRYFIGELYMTDDGIQKSSSEATQSLLNTLLYYKFTDEEIINIMNFSMNTHWQKYHTAQKLNEIKRAKEFYNEVKGTQRSEDKNDSVKRLRKTLGEQFSVLDNVHEFCNRQPIYYDNVKNWWLWSYDLGYWEKIDETDIMNAIDGNVDNHFLITKRIKGQILEALQRLGRLKKPKQPEPSWVQFKNNVVDVKTGDVFNTTHQYFFTNPIPWRLGTGEETPMLDILFKEWVGDKYIQTLYEIIAYCMIPAYPIHRIFCFHGGGSNGKSTFLNILQKFIGRSNVTSTELDFLIKNSFEVAKLYKKLVCFMGETNFGDIKKTSTLKRLSGGDLVSFEFKNKMPIDDVNYAKLIIATNSIPPTQDKSEGYYRRWTPIGFPNKFSEKRDIMSEIPDKEYENLAAKCVKLLPQLLRRRTFTNEGTVDQRRQAYEDASNPLQKFIRLKTQNDSENYILKWEFFNRFITWQKENGQRPWSKQEVGVKMKELFEEKKVQLGKDDDGNYIRQHAWLCLSWRTNLHDYQTSILNSDKKQTFLSFMSSMSRVKQVNNAYKREVTPNSLDMRDTTDINKTVTNEEVIHHKCQFCHDKTKCMVYSKTGKPMCSECLANPNLSHEHPDGVKPPISKWGV